MSSTCGIATLSLVANDRRRIQQSLRASISNANLNYKCKLLLTPTKAINYTTNNCIRNSSPCNSLFQLRLCHTKDTRRQEEVPQLDS